ncbi:carbohydrate esterase family 1 and carbohydrate-binding module family 1 protein [Mycena latifolia]|nr:carbohydrate esterase family 1 and carbohydrate-binding module family 1 protein [Mycena latifolia]
MGHLRLALLLSILWSGPVVGLNSTLQQVTDFGINPTNVGMFAYIPTSVTATPAVVVAIHDCNGTAQTYFASSPYPQFADTYGFIVIYPSSPNTDTCWDVTSPATLIRDGGGDSQGIASMVDYAISTYSADPTRISVTGTASGGTMTSILMATYPELWRTATIYSGAAAGCFVNTSTVLGSYCTVDDDPMDGDYWAAVVRAMYPGYNGTYPPVQVWYSSDTSFWTSYAFRAILEWSSILGCDTLGGSFEWLDYPTYTKFVYTCMQTIMANEADPVPTHGDEDMAWFGIDPSLAPPVNPPPPPLPPVQHWGQCGGIGWNGGTVCVAPYTCVVNNAYVI